MGMGAGAGATNILAARGFRNAQNLEDGLGAQFD